MLVAGQLLQLAKDIAVIRTLLYGEDEEGGEDEGETLGRRGRVRGPRKLPGTSAARRGSN